MLWKGSLTGFSVVGLLMVAASRSAAALERRLRIVKMTMPTMKAIPAKPPTAMPAIAPVAREEDDLGVPRVYFRVKRWSVIMLTEGPGVGAMKEKGGVVTQGVAPAISEVYIDQPLDRCQSGKSLGGRITLTRDSNRP